MIDNRYDFRMNKTNFKAKVDNNSLHHMLLSTGLVKNWTIKTVTNPIVMLPKRTGNNE